MQLTCLKPELLDKFQSLCDMIKTIFVFMKTVLFKLSFTQKIYHEPTIKKNCLKKFDACLWCDDFHSLSLGKNRRWHSNSFTKWTEEKTIGKSGNSHEALAEYYYYSGDVVRALEQIKIALRQKNLSSIMRTRLEQNVSDLEPVVKRIRKKQRRQQVRAPLASGLQAAFK